MLGDDRRQEPRGKGSENGSKGALTRTEALSHLAAEISPGELCGVPLNNVVVDRLPRRRELATHHHEERVEHVDLVVNGNQGTSTDWGWARFLPLACCVFTALCQQSDARLLKGW